MCLPIQLFETVFANSRRKHDFWNRASKIGEHRRVQYIWPV